ncbi:MAG: hypothetical protein MJE66_17845, partial [Proteobacteria bacterium]|nr:hypothetical protein [Pseudomonadota bacterium]
RTLRRWVDEIIRAGVLLPVGAGFALLLSGLVMPTGGVLPTAGAVLLGDRLGLVWARITGRRARHQIGLGIGIACGALLTRWSGVTDALFLVGGGAVILSAISRRSRAPDQEERPSRRSKRERSERSEREGPRRKRRRRKRVPADPRRRR